MSIRTLHIIKTDGILFRYEEDIKTLFMEENTKYIGDDILKWVNLGLHRARGVVEDLEELRRIIEEDM